MTTEGSDRPIRDLIAKHFLPPDLCPSDPEAIEAMLDAAGGKPIGQEQIQRMLKKAAGQLPVGEREDDFPEWSEEEEECEEARELLALHRNEKGDLPPDIEEKLRKLREQAKKKKETNGGNELETGTGSP
jgi:hypothetical protein